MRALAVVLALLVATPLLPVAQAMPVLDSGSANNSGGWKAWRIHSDGNRWIVDVEGKGFQDTFGGGFILFDDSMKVAFAYAEALDASDHGVEVAAYVSTFASVRHTVIPDAQRGADARFTLDVFGAKGTWTLLAWVTPAASWSWSFAAAGSATSISGWTSGSRSLLVSMDDATGTLGARVDTLGYLARANTISMVPFHTGAGLFAVTASNGIDFVTVNGPGGTVPCQRGQPQGIGGDTMQACAFARPTAGPYTAHLTGAAAGFKAKGEFYLLVADAILPG